MDYYKYDMNDDIKTKYKNQVNRQSEKIFQKTKSKKLMMFYNISDRFRTISI